MPPSPVDAHRLQEPLSDAPRPRLPLCLSTSRDPFSKLLSDAPRAGRLLCLQLLSAFSRTRTPPRPRYLLGSGPSVSQRRTSGWDTPPPRLKTLNRLPKPLCETSPSGRDPLHKPYSDALAPPLPVPPANTYSRGPQRLPAQEQLCPGPGCAGSPNTLVFPS